MIRKLILLRGLIAAATTFALAGCGKAPPATGTGSVPHKDGDHKDNAGGHKDAKGGDHKDDEHKEGAGHGHKPGGHGGIVVSLGKDSYHAEAVFEKEGVVRLYLLGKDEIKPQEVDVQDLVAYVTPSGSTDATQVKLAADRQKTDAAGKASQFVAKLPPELHGKTVKVTVNNIQVGAERFRIEFSNEKNEKGGAGH
jgi:hypothetical protein